MQKFREYLYLDENKIDMYCKQIPELSKIETGNSAEKTTIFDGGVNVGVGKAMTNIGEKYTKNYIINHDKIENFINWIFTKGNAILYDKENISLDCKDNLILFTGKMFMPEMGENIEMMNSIAKNTSLFNMIPISDEDRAIMSCMKENENIPFLIDMNSNYIFNCNLKKENIIGSKNDFLDIIEDDVNVIGKIDKVYNSSENIEIYDLAKEIFKLNRAIRKNLDKETLSKTIIVEQGPLIKIIPLIIYK